MLSADLLSALLGGAVTDWGDQNGPDATRVLFWEAGAVRDAETWTSRTYREADDLVEFYNGSEEQCLELRQPVADGTPVVAIGYGASWTNVVAERVTVRKHPRLGINNLLYLDAGLWPYGEGNIRVTYEGGYEENGEPEEIRTLVARLTMLRFNGTPVAVSASTSPSADTALPDDLRAIVERWRWSEAIIAHRLVRAS